MSKITDAVASLAEAPAAALGLEIWDVEFVREAGTRYLRIYIDKDGGVGINDCVAFSQAMDPLLDEADPIAESYTFEVSSAGLERELKKPAHFARYLGSPVEVRHFSPVEGSKSHTGTLRGYDGGAVTIEFDGESRTFTKEQVAQVRLRME